MENRLLICVDWEWECSRAEYKNVRLMMMMMMMMDDDNDVV